MVSLRDTISRWLGRSEEIAQTLPVSPQGRILRRSSGLAEFSRTLAAAEGLRYLDLGPTSAQNITRLAKNASGVHNEDVLLASFNPKYQKKGEKGASILDVEGFFTENLRLESQRFDAVYCWDIPDYLPEPIVRPMVARLCEAMNPGAPLLAFFHTKDAGPEAPYFRYHLAGDDVLDLQPGPRFRLQRIFQNRHIENLFKDFSNIKFFLAKDDVREVLVIR